jgi:Tfp pilus assembly protein FimT
MTMVVALTIVVSVISVISLMPILSAQHVVNAYNTTLSAMRQARDNAVSQRTSYSVTFQNATIPNTITVTPTLTGFQGDQNTTTYTLPTDVLFLAQSAVASTPAPDGFGSGANAIDFGYTADNILFLPGWFGAGRRGWSGKLFGQSGQRRGVHRPIGQRA